MVSLEVRREREAAGRRRKRLVGRSTTLSPQLSFPGLEPKPLVQQIPFNSSGKTTSGSQQKHPDIWLPYKDY